MLKIFKILTVATISAIVIIFFVGVLIFTYKANHVSNPVQEIGDTGLSYVNVGPLNRYITSTGSDGVNQIGVSVNSSVLGFMLDNNRVMGLRQIVYIYSCKGREGLLSEVTDRLEFFVISILDKAPKYDLTLFSEFSEFKNYLETRGTSFEIINKFLPSLYEEKLVHVGTGFRCAVDDREFISE